jgi:phospholipid/cholesterol/gamma-HCH transport system substrate-binding protein
VTTKKTHVRVGIFVIGALALGAFVLLTFGGARFFEHRDHYEVDFKDSVLGLETGAAVSFDGLEVGRVDNIAVSPTDLSAVRVEFSVKRGTPVHTDTIAFISMAGLTGLKTIDLRGGKLDTPVMARGGVLQAGQGTLDKIEARAEELVDQSQKMMQQAGRVVDTAQQVAQNLQAATDPKPIQAIIHNAELTTRTLQLASVGVATMVAEDRASVHDALASLDAASHSANDLVANQVAHLVGNANDLVADLRSIVQGNGSEMRAAMTDLRQASQSIAELSREVRDRPSRLLFSPTPKDRKLP